MVPLVKGILVFIMAGSMAAGEARAAIAPQQANPAENETQQSEPAKLMQQIALYERAARSAETLHVERTTMSRIYSRLGDFYANAGLFLKAEDAMKRAVGDMKEGPRAELALEYAQLGVVHVEMGKTREGEKDEMKALRIRETMGDPILVAFTQSDLAGLYSIEQKFKKAVEYAQKAYEVLGDRSAVSVDDRVQVRLSLGFALTAVRSCGKGLPILKDALDLARSSPAEPGRKMGYAEYVLGYGYWHCGDNDRASAWLQRGTTDMKADFGWDRSLYVNAMSQYAKFLRTTGQLAAAQSAEAVVNQADAVVDARSMTGMSDGFR